MPIVTSDLQYRLSGGAANSVPDNSLGGAISSTALADATLQNLFDNAPSSETTSGSTSYRCFYVRNGHATLALQAAKVWIQTQTPSPDTSVEIGLGTSAVNGTEQTVANENTAPTGVTFSAPSTEGAALSIGDIPAGQHKAVWIKRIINPGSAAYNDSTLLRLKGDTGA